MIDNFVENVFILERLKFFVASQIIDQILRAKSGIDSLPYKTLLLFFLYKVS